jgi:hypothetical protein
MAWGRSVGEKEGWRPFWGRDDDWRPFFGRGRMAGDHSYGGEDDWRPFCGGRMAGGRYDGRRRAGCRYDGGGGLEAVMTGEEGWRPL